MSDSSSATSAAAVAASNSSSASTVYKGGCHCGAVRFEVTVPNDKHELLDCNCSICTKKGFLHLIATPSQFHLLSGSDSLSLYSFQTHTAKHLFCKTCGIASFYRPRSHPNDYSVNARCLDQYQKVKDRFRTVQYDGENWEQAKKDLDATEAAASATVTNK